MVNGYRSHTFGWGEVRGVTLRVGSPWAILELADGRRFRADGARPGPVAEIHIHDPDVFARLIREGDMGFSEAYVEGGWSTPDLQAFMDLVHVAGDDIYDGFPGMGVLRLVERARHALRRNSRRQARRDSR